MRPQSSLLKDDRGAVAPITIVMMVAFFALLASVVDLGHLMLVRSQLQNAADAGALAGARALFYNNSSTTPNWVPARNAAIAAVESNKADTLLLEEPAANVTYGYWNTANGTLSSSGIVPGPTDVAAVKVVVQKNSTSNGPVAMTFGQIFGISTVNVASHAIAMVMPPSNGPFANAVFSNQNVSITGAESITGSAFSNNNLTINGAETITGSAVGVTGVTLIGAGSIGSVVAGTLSEINDSQGAFSIGSTSGGATAIAMPNYSQQIQQTAATTYNGNYVQNSAMNISGNMYITGTASLTGAINDSGAILANGSITISGAASISGDSQIFLYSANGNITITGATAFGTGDSSAILYAPNGIISISGASSINGGIVANQVTLPGGAFSINGGFPIQFLQQFSPPVLVQ